MRAPAPLHDGLGTGTLTLLAHNTFTGPTTVDSGTLALNYRNGADGTLAGGANITVDSSGTLQLNANSALGWSTGIANWVTINGGTMNIAAGLVADVPPTVNMTGGTISASGGGSANGTSYTFYAQTNATSDAAGNPATISAPKIGLAGSPTFNVTRRRPRRRRT